MRGYWQVQGSTCSPTGVSSRWRVLCLCTLLASKYAVVMATKLTGDVYINQNLKYTNTAMLICAN